MHPFFQDAFDLARFRVKPLTHYRYVWWLPPLWLCVLNMLPMLWSSEITAPMPAKLLFAAVIGMVQGLLVTLYFAWWLKLGERWDGQGALFPLFVLCSSPQILQPLVLVFPEAMQLPLLFLMGLYLVVLNVVAISRATGVPLRHVLLGLLSYLPAALLLGMLSLGFLSSMGWVKMPQDVTQPMSSPATAPEINKEP